MIDKVVDVDELGNFIWISDLYPYETFIGFEDLDGVVIMYHDEGDIIA